MKLQGMKEKKNGIFKTAKTAAVCICVAAVVTGCGAGGQKKESYLKPIAEKVEGYNNRLYGIKEDMSVFYPDEAIKLAEEYMENTQEYTARDLYEKWEDPEHYQNIFFDDAKTRFDGQYGEDWKITYEEKEATKLSQEKVDQLTQEYQRDPITVYPKSVFPVIYMTGSKDEQKLKDWFCQEEVKEAYEVTVDMKIEGSKGEDENEAKAIVVNYGGDWILYGNSSPDALVYELEFH